MNLEAMHDLVASLAAPGERYCFMVAGGGREYGVRVIVGREVLAAVDERDLGATIAKAQDLLEQMASDDAVVAAAE